MVLLSLAALVSMACTPITGIVKISLLAVNLGALENSYTGFCVPLQPIRGHAKQRTRWRGRLSSATLHGFAHGMDKPFLPEGNRSGISMHPREHGTLEKLRVETGGVAR